MPDERRPDRLERTLEVMLYAPLGVGLWLRDLAPGLVQTLVSRGRAEFDRRHEEVGQRVRHARGMGEVTMAFGVPALRRRADARIDEARRRVTDLVHSVVPEPLRCAPERAARGAGDDGPTAADVAPAADAPDAAGRLTESAVPVEERPSAAHLPITGYDTLSASQVVQRLEGLTSEELDAVRAYEEATRRRRTVIGKIEQLTG